MQSRRELGLIRKLCRDPQALCRNARALGHTQMNGSASTIEEKLLIVHGITVKQQLFFLNAVLMRLNASR